MDSRPKTLSSFLLHHPSTKFIRLQFVDLSGILRTRIVTTQHCLDMIAEGQHATVGGKSMLFSVTDRTSSIVAFVGVCELHPDWRSLRVCGYAPGHAAVMCCVYDKYFEEEPFHLCPRRKLADFVTECEASQSKKFLVGFEVEFVLLDPSGEPPRTVDAINAWSTTSGLRGDTLKLIEETVEALQASGISVLQFHTVEPNQLQIATGPLSPLDAIDALMHTNECIKHVSVRHGLRVTMAPKALREDIPTGTHAHISIHPPSGQENFLAGILNNLQTLCAFGLASYDSYSRVTELRNAAGAWVAWGTENRYLPIRGIKNARWELRYLDATANFYLALLATFAAGMQGLKEKAPLQWHDCQQNPLQFGESKRKEFGIVKQLPKSMREAIEILRESTSLDEVLGKSLKPNYIAMKEVDESDMGAWSEDRRREWFTKLF
jgi:glutamine synthetase